MSQAASRAFAASVAGLTGVRLLGVASGFAVSVIGARLLDQAAFGAANVAITVGMIAALIGNGGVNIATIYLGGRLPERRSDVFGATTTIALTGSIIAIAFSVVAGLSFGGALKLDGRSDLFAGAAAVGAGIIGLEYGGAVLLSLVRNRAYGGIELLRSATALLATAILVLAWRADTAFVLATALGYLVAGAAALGMGHAATGAIRPAWNADLVGRSLAMGLRGQVGNVLQFLNLRIDLLLIPAMLQLTAAGLYIVAARVSEVLTQVANAAGSLIFPAVAGGDPNSTLLTERTVRLSLLVVAVAAVPLLLAAQPFLVLAFGDDYAGGDTALRILAVAMLPLSVTRILAGDLKGRGRPGLVSIATSAALVVNVALDVALIPTAGIAGAAVASFVANSASAVVLVVAFVRLTNASPVQLVPRPADVALLVRAARAVGRTAR